MAGWRPQTNSGGREDRGSTWGSDMMACLAYGKLGARPDRGSRKPLPGAKDQSDL